VGSVHEYSTIPGVWESTFEILNNLKKIKIRRDDFPFKPFEKQVIQITMDEPGIMKASAIELPFPLKILNEDEPIATVFSAHLVLTLTITIEANTGTQLWTPTKQTYPVNTALSVSEFNLPVKWANFVLKSDSLFGANSSETVLFEMLTDGTITPPEAIEKAAELCINLFSFLSKEEKAIEIENQPFPLSTPIIMPQLIPGEFPQLNLITDEFPIEDLGLSVRAYNCLKRAKIQNVTDLLGYSKVDLLEMKNFGKKSADEVSEALQNKLGIHLPL
jgi:DNA-directed RNA polymerase subunit alpha